MKMPVDLITEIIGGMPTAIGAVRMRDIRAAMEAAYGQGYAAGMWAARKSIVEALDRAKEETTCQPK